MPFGYIERGIVAFAIRCPLNPGENIQSLINGKPVTVSVLETWDSITINGVLRHGRAGAVLFDRQLGGTQCGIVHFRLEEVNELNQLYHKLPPGQFIATLAGVFRRCQEQVGARNKDKGYKTTLDTLASFLSSGNADRY